MSNQTEARLLVNGVANGRSIAKASEKQAIDASLADQVIAATGPRAHARLASILPSLVKHLHAFMRESEITNQELMAAFDLVSLPTTVKNFPLSNTL